MKNIKLSVCIPTYNDAKHIEKTIQSIIDSADKSVEIIISDNASTDNTKEIVKPYEQKFSNLKYYRSPENVGAAINFLKSVKLACGEYCLLLGSDDAFAPEGLKQLLVELDGDADICIYNQIFCNYNLDPVKVRAWFPNNIKTRIFDFSIRDDLLDYLTKARELVPLFSCMSNVVFKRKRWLNAQYDAETLFSNFPHVFRLWSFIKQGLKVKYINKELIYYRNNPTRGGSAFEVYNRDLNEYFIIAEKLFPNDPTLKRLFMKVMIKEVTYPRVFQARILSSEENWKSFKEKLFVFGYNKILIEFCDFFGFLAAKLKAHSFLRKLYLRLSGCSKLECR